MTEYEVTLKYESGLTEPAVEECISAMTGVAKEQVQVEVVDKNE